MRLLATLTCCVLAALLSPPAFAAGDVASRSEMYHVTYRLNEDFTDTAEFEFQGRVLEESALDDMKQLTVSFSASVQKLDILEAYTLKADGRRLPVPAGNYQGNANTGKDAGPVFSDYATLGLVFPDLEVGDATHVRYRITQTEPIFPGQFEADADFFPSREYDDIRIVIDAPAGQHAHVQARVMAQAEEARDGRRILTFTWSNPKATREKRKDWSVYDAGHYPGFAYSTFDDYAAIARAYGARAIPKAAVTERIRKLSRQIVKGKSGDREKARALYEWVARNITYGGNCVGTGSVVPRDTEFVLDNRMGDCKDHATLLQALLAAQGIAATQALLNASSLYALPPVPMVSSVNHVINYLPGLDLFLDSTSSSTPFGYLPDGDAGKPVLLVEGYRDNMRTPVTPYAANSQQMASEIEYLPDGTARGKMHVDLHGRFAIDARRWARDINDEVREQLVERYFNTDGHKGSGTIDMKGAEALDDAWAYDVQFVKPAALNLPGAGGLYIVPLFYSWAPVGRFVGANFEVQDGIDTACSGGVSEESHTIRLPAATTLFAIPDDVHIAQGPFSYDATYRLDGTTITAHRKIVDRTPGPVCTPEFQAGFQQFSRRVLRDLRAQAVYQLKDAADAAAP